MVGHSTVTEEDVGGVRDTPPGGRGTASEGRKGEREGGGVWSGAIERDLPLTWRVTEFEETFPKPLLAMQK